ncbi:MAG: hybrid sensor histidine kinase/response regulator [Candidatus Omnitrophica bacterium]|nr:hybrid sensor histidine kinase/response regulator [Candidatus Omnitrophota bacterium]MDD5436278.1 hybrid sensor histidine kinase/response regulator [Candidatus Omnitrophota bacterium]
MRFPGRRINVIDILVVDDDAGARKSFGNILKLKGYGVETAGTGQEAISKIKEKFFNIVFLDIRLPDISGLEVLKTISDFNEDIVTIMVTAYASIDSSIDAINKDAYSYITKPVNMDQVLQVIGKALEKQRLAMENKRLLKELKEANEKLREMDARKSDFVANVSHEFKNPLAVIKQSLTIVLEGMAGEINPKQKEILEAGQRNIERLIRLVMDLLDLSKIESGKIEMKRDKIDITSLVDQLLKDYENEISRKNLVLNKDIQPDMGMVWADKDKLTEVIINLLNNAIKYTNKGSVTVKLSGTEDEIRFEVADTGPGIKKEYLEKIFDKFERILAERQEGTGLGLSIAKDIVRLHKGNIWVESEPGKGSKFIFTLPRDLRRS